MKEISSKQTTSSRGAKTYTYLAGGNLGNETILMRLSQRELLDMCVVMNIENISVDKSLANSPHTQRRLYDDHAKALAKYGLLGLVNITIAHMEDAKKTISNEILDITKELEGGDSSYQAFQPMVANLMNCAPGGTDLTRYQMQYLNPVTGQEEDIPDVFKIVLSPQNRISLLDGQHRREGFSMVDKWLIHVTSTALYPKKGLYVPESGDLRISPEMIQFWMDVYMIACHEATLSIEIHLGLDPQQQRQLFNDLNAKGKKVEISLQQDFDRADAINKVIMEDLIGNAIPWKISKTDQEDWAQDDGSLVRKYLNPITALAMLGKSSSKGVTPLKADRTLLQAKSFWGMVSKIPNFGKPQAKANTVAAQPVVLKGLAKLFYDTGFGQKNVRNEDDYNKLTNNLRKIDFKHTNALWGSIMLDSATRNKTFPGIEDYVFVPKGTNLDAGTIDPNFNWVRYGMKHNDIFPRIGDLIRYVLKMNPRPSVTRAIEKEKNNP